MRRLASRDNLLSLRCLHMGTFQCPGRDRAKPLITRLGSRRVIEANAPTWRTGGLQLPAPVRLAGQQPRCPGSGTQRVNCRVALCIKRHDGHAARLDLAGIGPPRARRDGAAVGARSLDRAAGGRPMPAAPAWPAPSRTAAVMSDPAQSRSRSKSRLEAFSDGVFAIAITLLVLEIAVPTVAGNQLLSELVHERPIYLAYFIAFMTIGIVWIDHSALTRHSTTSTPAFSGSTCS